MYSEQKLSTNYLLFSISILYVMTTYRNITSKLVFMKTRNSIWFVSTASVILNGASWSSKSYQKSCKPEYLSIQNALEGGMGFPSTPFRPQGISDKTAGAVENPCSPIPVHLGNWTRSSMRKNENPDRIAMILVWIFSASGVKEIWKKAKYSS